ncbi:DUF6891 domain-containing protein [Leucobacter chromiireducens]|uniref:DUF6891 domain-containing protein n=1 Tax=Leucobacter chromiireducens subsp. chromiireducens TaxID=660067 RepID=A0ABS1SP04_9MICO|nr:hypothetical protein [Leucobacter chromiireducens]MBL3689300.1 hypothetical protein [Leucobacter chromiireducens subsp. chromiireducens]
MTSAANPETQIAQAFAALADAHVIARTAFTCCGTCGDAEIWDERDESGGSRGYVFYHSQDAEWLAESGETFLNYGAFLDAFFTEDEWEALAESAREERYAEIVAALLTETVFPVLRQHGLEVEWDQDLGTRVLLRVPQATLDAS